MIFCPLPKNLDDEPGMEKFDENCAGNQLRFAPKTTNRTVLRIPLTVVMPHPSFRNVPTNQMHPFTPFIRPKHRCNRIKRPRSQSSWADRIIEIPLKEEYPLLQMKGITFKPKQKRPRLRLPLPPVLFNDHPPYRLTRRQHLVFNPWMEKHTVQMIWMECPWSLIHFDSSNIRRLDPHGLLPTLTTSKSQVPVRHPFSCHESDL